MEGADNDYNTYGGGRHGVGVTVAENSLSFCVG